MILNELTAISPIDGRYRKKVEPLSELFSEFALIKYRVFVEIEYFLALYELQLPEIHNIPISVIEELPRIFMLFNLKEAEKIKETEKTIRHDVKSVEYYLKQKFLEICQEHSIDNSQAEKWSEFFHFGLTSQDINNTAIPLLLKIGTTQVLIPAYEQVIHYLYEKSLEWKDIPMLARTHGQPASPTKVGKELKVFVERLIIQIEELKKCDYPAKFGGATGNFNAHFVAYPHIDWVQFANDFVSNRLGLLRSQTTTQIEHYDNLAKIFDCYRRLNVILIDLCRDCWGYISLDYFKQKVNANEVGSSAMPHKVNPIDFENAEGNLGVANALFEHLSQKLPISRFQRDLTDSTVLRVVGVPIGHTFLSLQSLLMGLEKLEIHQTKIMEDLNENWAVLAEAIQTVLRKEGYPQPYEALKQLTRTNQKITQQSIHEFIQTLNVRDEIKNQLLELTPFNYTGNA
ncbi:MAG: adenylosuccinate lyase [Bacteroidia bacterium]|jgi:adenylosuccinate lyase|nr:MAG: adenylosuccinate lyase [Bacteroidia bacterium]